MRRRTPPTRLKLTGIGERRGIEPHSVESHKLEFYNLTPPRLGAAEMPLLLPHL